MIRFAALVALVLAGCAEPPADAPEAPPSPIEPSTVGAAATPDTLRLDAEATALAGRPTAPIRIDGACPFEGCTYGTWTTSAETTVYAAPGDTVSAAFTVPAGTALAADRGFVLLTALGRSVARRPTEVYLDFQTTRPVAAGDTLVVLDYEGEGSYRVWTDGVLAFSDEVISLGGAPGVEPTFDLLAEPASQWWAHVVLPDGRSGWLWMERTPDVEGADALG